MLGSPHSDHCHPSRSRSGRNQGDLEEEEDEPTHYLSPHTRRSLAIQEAHQMARDRKRRRGENEEAELDESAGPGCDGLEAGHLKGRGGGTDEVEPSDGDGLSM